MNGNHTLLVVVYKNNQGVLPVLLSPAHRGNDIVYAMDNKTAFGYRISLTKDSSILFDDFLQMQDDVLSIPMTIDDVEAIYEVGELCPETMNTIYGEDIPFVEFFTKEDLNEE